MMRLLPVSPNRKPTTARHNGDKVEFVVAAASSSVFTEMVRSWTTRVSVHFVTRRQSRGYADQGSGHTDAGENRCRYY